MFEVNDIRSELTGPISFRVEAGQCLGIKGASGSGKTILLRLLADLDPHEGSMVLDGDDYLSMTGPAWRQRVAYLPAESQWWESLVGMHFENPDLPQFELLGFGQQVLEWDVNRLSSGERQRLALLRLLQNGPSVLLLDEPTANLDPVSSSKVEQMLMALKQSGKVALVWVSHDASQLERIADRVMTMERGMLQ